MISETVTTRVYLAYGPDHVILEGALAEKAEAYLAEFHGPDLAVQIKRIVDARVAEMPA